MQIDVVHLPRDLKESHLRNRTVVVFDVLRATTTMITALNAGAKEIRIFATLDEARSAARGFADAKLLCGESCCVRPDGFDLGNSPREFTSDKVRGKTIFMCTTNGTKAIVAASGAAEILIASLINASATARYLAQASRDVTMLCAGTDGERAIEDEFAAQVVISKMNGDQIAAIDLRTGRGGQNLIAAGLEADIDFAARVDSIDRVGIVQLDPLRVMINPRPT